jgi:hypothetical protein
VAEIGVIGEEEPAVLGTPTPVPVATDTPTPTDTPMPTPTNTATALTATPTRSVPTATNTPVPPPQLTPIHALFNQATFSTTYTENASGDNLGYGWSVSIPLDPPCAAGFHPNISNPNQATWFHADVSAGGPCDHGNSIYNAAGSGHPGTVTVTVSNANWTCIATYFGTQGANGTASGDGPPPQPCQTK